MGLVGKWEGGLISYLQSDCVISFSVYSSPLKGTIELKLYFILAGE